MPTRNAPKTNGLKCTWEGGMTGVDESSRWTEGTHDPCISNRHEPWDFGSVLEGEPPAEMQSRGDMRKTFSPTRPLGSRDGVAHRNPPTDPRNGPKPARPAMTRERQRRDTRQPGATPRVGTPTTDPSPERAKQTMVHGDIPKERRAAGPMASWPMRNPKPPRLRASAGDSASCA